MKGWTALLVLAAAALLATGCARTADATSAAPAAPASEAVSAAAPAAQSAVSSGTMEAVSTVNARAPLTEQEILTAYDRAAEAWNWFVLGTLAGSGPDVELDGQAYRRVERPGLETMDDLRVYLGSLFSPALVERLLSRDGPPLCREEDGVLYARAGDFGEEPARGRRTITVERISDTAYQLNASVETLGADSGAVTGVECFSFPYRLVDGRWVFTDFASVN